MAGWVLDVGSWQAGCWRWEHGRQDDGDGKVASWMLEMGTSQA